jgi:hypothetical protein
MICFGVKVVIVCHRELVATGAIWNFVASLDIIKKCKSMYEWTIIEIII